MSTYMHGGFDYLIYTYVILHLANVFIMRYKFEVFVKFKDFRLEVEY